ncbi:MAG: hypothetical protein QOJ44_868 [Acidimicrobiaceae bacterium]|nr:hypothetical protein [Acidimicrobiaceae bacterium]
MTEDIERRHVATSLPVAGANPPVGTTPLGRHPRHSLWLSIPAENVVDLVLAVDI